MNSLDNLERDNSAPYTDGLLNDNADTYFDPDVKYIDNVRDRIFIDGLKEYASKIRSFNWSYYDTKSFTKSTRKRKICYKLRKLCMKLKEIRKWLEDDLKDL